MFVKTFTAVVLLFAASTTMSATFQSANAIDFDTGVDVGGAGTLLREDDGVEVRIALSRLKKNAAYSVWWIIFNNPDGCIGGAGACALIDVDPMSPSNSAVINAAGFVTGASGTANFTAELEVGPTPAGVTNPFGNLESSTAAEVHMIFQTHGKIVPGSLNLQMTVPFAVCTPKCKDEQAIIFLPVP